MASWQKVKVKGKLQQALYNREIKGWMRVTEDDFQAAVEYLPRRKFHEITAWIMHHHDKQAAIHRPTGSNSSTNSHAVVQDCACSMTQLPDDTNQWHSCVFVEWACLVTTREESCLGLRQLRDTANLKRTWSIVLSNSYSHSRMDSVRIYANFFGINLIHLT